MQAATFTGRDDECRRTRQTGVRPIHAGRGAQGASGQRHHLTRRSAGVVVKVAVEHAYPQAFQAVQAWRRALHHGGHRLHPQCVTTRVMGIGGLQRVIGQRQPGNAVGHRA